MQREADGVTLKNEDALIKAPPPQSFSVVTQLNGQSVLENYMVFLKQLYNEFTKGFLSPMSFNKQSSDLNKDILH